jgi:hypothetical protein
MRKRGEKESRHARRAAAAQEKKARHARRKQNGRVGARQGHPARLDRVPATGLGVFGRALAYAHKQYGLWSLLWNTRDGRQGARIPTGRVAVSFVVLMLTRMRSLNGYEQLPAPVAWEGWLGGPRPSADVMGDVASTIGLDPLRGALGVQHRVLKRSKGFGRIGRGWRFLVLDGHEGVASYRRRWDRALERVVHFAKGDKTQYFFRYVGAYLTNGQQRLLLDAEAQWPGEGEIACALRLLTRLFARYPRAFDVVCGDNLYMNPDLWKLVRSHRKHLIAVLKNEDRDLLKDARGLFAGQTPTALNDKKTRRQCWDTAGFTTWPQCGESVRVVRTVEQTIVLRQLTSETSPAAPAVKTKKPRGKCREEETLESEWFWVTSLPPHLADTAIIVRAGHGRWDIENRMFNELSTRWYGDHGYRYHAHAFLACTLFLFIAYNLFIAFLERNLKPQLRARYTALQWADLIRMEMLHAFFVRAGVT